MDNRAEKAPSGSIAPSAATRPDIERVSELPVGIERRTVHPRPCALIVGDLDRGALCPTLDRLECTYVDLHEVDLLSAVHHAGTFALIFVGPAGLAAANGNELIRELAAANPAAKVILVCAVAEMAPGLLVEAIRCGVGDVVDSRDDIALSTSIDAVFRSASERAERVLAIGAHPDDVEIGCAGTLLEHRRRGDAIAILTLSRGDVGGNRAERILESTAAAAHVGAELLLGDLPDTRVDAGIETIKMIEAVVRFIDPTVVYVHSKHDNHQDHRAVHAAAVSATRGVARVFGFQSPSATNDFAPTKFIAIDDVVAHKVEILQLFESQGQRSYLEPEMVVAGARYWARNLAPRARYAEPFEVIRSVTRTRPAEPARPVGNGRPTAPVVNIRDRSAVDA